MNLKKFLLNLIVMLFAFSSIAEEKVLKDLTLRELDELLDYTIATGGI